MRKVGVVTGSRADFGILRPLLKGIDESSDLELCLIVTGSHLSKDLGYTVAEVRDSKLPIASELDILSNSDSRISVCESIGKGVIQFSKCFDLEKPDILLVLGDRYEILAAVQAALVLNIPVAHLHGGETTEGAFDESIRHAITKMSQVHFTSTETYKNRVIQMGENPSLVFNVGALGLETISKMKFLTREELENSLEIKLKENIFLVTFHPETLSELSAGEQVKELFEALLGFDQNVSIIFTLSNADPLGREVSKLVEDWCSDKEDALAFPSLGSHRYLSLMKESSLVIGNSSSGIIEAPFFGVRTVNIGDRQKGRVAAPSIYHCGNNKKQIKDAIRDALEAGNTLASDMYGSGNTSQKVLEILRDLNLHGIVKKPFYDLRME